MEFFSNKVSSVFQLSINYELNNFLGLNTVIENYFNNKKNELNENGKSLEELEEQFGNDEYANHIFEGQIEEYQNFTETFPDLIRRSLFLTSYSFLEKNLIDICKHTENNSSSILLSDLKGSGINQVKTYLQKVLKIEQPLFFQHDSELKLLSNIRNASIHNNGVIERKIEQTIILIENCKVLYPNINLQEHSKEVLLGSDFNKVFLERSILTFNELISSLHDKGY